MSCKSAILFKHRTPNRHTRSIPGALQLLILITFIEADQQSVSYIPWTFYGKEVWFRTVPLGQNSSANTGTIETRKDLDDRMEIIRIYRRIVVEKTNDLSNSSFNARISCVRRSLLFFDKIPEVVEPWTGRFGDLSRR